MIIGSGLSYRKSGVPHGSVLCQLLFVIYTLTLGDIMNYNEADYQIYADDNELNIAFNTDNFETQTKAKKIMENV